MNSTGEHNDSMQCFFLTYFISTPTTVTYAITMVTCIMTGIISISGVFANVLVCIAIMRNRTLRIHSNILLLALSINDLLIGLITEPLYITRRVLETSGVYLCWVTLTYRTTWNISIGLSFILVTLISCERFFALFFPFLYNQHITRRKLVLSALTCSVSWALLPISRFFGLGSRSFYYISSVLIVSVIVVIAVLQVKIFKLARYHHVQISLTSVSSVGQQDPRTKKKTGRLGYSAREATIARSIACVVGAVFLCYLPLVASVLAMMLTDAEVLFYYYILPWADLLVFVNSLLNPLIYCWRNRELRAAMFSMIKCNKHAKVPSWLGINSRQYNVEYAQSESNVGWTQRC